MSAPLFVRTLLDEDVSEEHLQSLAAQAGVPQMEEVGLIAIVPRPTTTIDMLSEAAAQVVDSLTHPILEPVAEPTPHVVVLHPGGLDVAALATLDRIAKLYDVAMVTSSFPGWAPLGQRYRRLRRYVHVANHHLRPPGAHPIETFAEYDELLDIPVDEAFEFVRKVLGPVLALPEPEARELMELLEVLAGAAGDEAAAAMWELVGDMETQDPPEDDATPPRG